MNRGPSFTLAGLGNGSDSVHIKKNIISLQAMCEKWWLEKVQICLKRNTSKPHVFALQRFLSDLPRGIRLRIINNGLKAGGLHLAHGSKEIPAINRSLIFISSDIVVNETIYVTISAKTTEYNEADVELLIRHGEGVSKLFLTLPPDFSSDVKRSLSDICRTCRNLTHITICGANDEALALITRHCRNLISLKFVKSPEVTDLGASRMVVNLKWSSTCETKIQAIDLGETSITQEGVMNLITRLPSVTSFGSSDILDAIEGIVLLTEDTSFKTSIEDVTLKCATVNRIKALQKYCPNINSIRATFQENPGATLNDLRLLKYLSSIEIAAREPFLLSQSNFYDFAWNCGSNLVKLKISGDIYWEVDLGALVGQCPNLKYLSLPAITLPTKESLMVLQTENSLTLTKLFEFEVDCMNGVCPKAWAKDFNLVRRGLVLALRRCKVLRKLVLRPSCLVDTDFSDIFLKNSLQTLEVMELYNSPLSLAGAKLIIDTCKNLHVMKGVKSWRGVTALDIVALRKYARGHGKASHLKIIP